MLSKLKMLSLRFASSSGTSVASLLVSSSSGVGGCCGGGSGAAAADAAGTLGSDPVSPPESHCCERVLRGGGGMLPSPCLGSVSAAGVGFGAAWSQLGQGAAAAVWPATLVSALLPLIHLMLHPLVADAVLVQSVHRWAPLVG